MNIVKGQECKPDENKSSQGHEDHEAWMGKSYSSLMNFVTGDSSIYLSISIIMKLSSPPSQFPISP